MTVVSKPDTQSLYESIHPMLLSLCRKYAGRTGDADDLMGECHMAFMRAVESYEEGHGREFGSWVYLLAENRIKKYLTRRKAKQMERLPMGLAKPNKRCLRQVCLDLEGGDGLKALLAARDTPPDVVITAMSNSFQGLNDPRSLRKAVRSYLRGLGWRRSRIDRAFTKVMEALCYG